MLNLSETTRLEIISLENVEFKLNGDTTTGVKLQFRDNPDNARSMLTKLFNKSLYRANLEYGSIKMDLGDYIFAKEEITHTKYSIKDEFILVKDNSNDVEIKELKERLEKQDATIDFLLATRNNKGDEPNA